MNLKIIAPFILGFIVAFGLMFLSVAQPVQARVEPSFLNSLSPHHVALSVPNLEETIQWYQDKLGFTMTLRRELPQFSTRQAFLELNGFQIEVFERENSTRTQPSPVNVPDDLLTQGYKHIAFTVDDIDAIATELKRRNVEVALEPVTDEELGLTICFIKDSNGNLIELVQE
jgi:methylmalonyl-CoA/ethylmalonyl-CoA epimerase